MGEAPEIALKIHLIIVRGLAPLLVAFGGVLPTFVKKFDVGNVFNSYDLTFHFSFEPLIRLIIIE